MQSNSKNKKLELIKDLNSSELSKLPFDELARIEWEIMEEAYQSSKPIRYEIDKRLQKQKKEFKKAS